jgi:hypothetical protein
MIPGEGRRWAQRKSGSAVPKLYNPASKEFDHSTFRKVDLICRISYSTADGVEIHEGDYRRFQVNAVDGSRQVFLTLVPGDFSYDAIEITKDVADGRFIVA